MGKRSSVLFEKTLPPDEKRALRGFAATLQSEILGGRAFVCLIGGDAKLQDLNRAFLKHDYPTDVLSFPSDQGGELALSLDRAEAQAAEHGHSRLEELKILMLHGALHLSGMDHVGDRGKMRRAETTWRKTFGLPSGLIERSRR